MKKLAVIISLILLTFSGSASAHIALRSDTGTSAIVHVTPDDDPIAGSKAGIFFDFSGLSVSDFDFKLTVFDSHGGSENIAVQTQGSAGVSAEYVFPVQGVYRLELSATPKPGGNSAESEILNLTQRVSRGTPGVGAVDKPTFAWAEAGMIGSACALLGIIIIIINRRGIIADFTRGEVNRRPK